MKPTKKLRRTAYHEAGHVFAHYNDGDTIKHVTITLQDDALGHVQVRTKIFKLIEFNKLSGSQTQKFYNYCIATFAGHASEKYFCGKPSPHGWSRDREQVVRIVRSLFGSDETVKAAVQLFYHQATDLIRTPKGKLLIPALAERLLEQKTLTGQEIKDLFSEVLREKFNFSG